MWHPTNLSDFEAPQNEDNKYIQETNHIYENSNEKQEDICQIDNEGITEDICKFDILEGQNYQNDTENRNKEVFTQPILTQSDLRKEEINMRQQYDQSLSSATESFTLLNDTLRLKDLPTSAQHSEEIKRAQTDSENEHNLMTNTEILQMKIVNEIFDFDEQQFQMVSQNEFMNHKAQSSSQQSSQQNGLMMDTNLVDFGRQIGSSTIKNLFEGTSDLQGMMANMEKTEDNNRLFEELNELNKTIKTIEELLKNQSREQKDLIQLKRNQPRQLKEELNQKNIQLRSLTRELIKLENERERQRQAEGEFRKQIDSQFEKENRILQSNLTELERNKQEISKELQILQEKWHCLQERKSTGKEELMAKLMQRAEMVAQMEDLEEMKDDFQLRFPLETQCMLSILQFTDEAETMVNQQKEIRNQLNLRRSKVQNISTLKISSQKSKQIEELITKKCIDLGCSSQAASSLFLQLFDSRCLELSKETIQRQIILIEREQLKLDEQLKTAESIQHLNSSRCSSNNNNSPQHSLSELNYAEELSNKSNFLTQWKEKAQEHVDLIQKRTSAMQSNSLSCFTFDRILIEELLKRQFHNLGITCDSCDIAFLGDLYEQYFEELSSLLSSKQSNEEYEYSSDAEGTQKLELELQNLSLNIQSKQNDIHSKRAILQGLLVQQADGAFNDYMVQQKQVFDGLENTYGKIVLQQIKQNHHQQFREIMHQDQEKRFKSIEEINTCMIKMNLKIKRNIDYVETQLSEDICSVQNDIERCSQEMNQLIEEQRNTRNACEECYEQLGILKSQKEQALEKKLQLELLFMSAGSYEKKKQSLQLQIESVESAIRNIELNLQEAFEKGIEQELSQRGEQQKQVDISETALKRQLDELLIQRFALESRLIEINFDIKPLEDDISCFPDVLNAQVDNQKESNNQKSERYSNQVYQQSVSRSPRVLEKLENNARQVFSQKDSIQTITEEQTSSHRDFSSRIEAQRIPKTNGYSTLPVYKRSQDENETINNIFDKSCQIYLNEDGVAKQDKPQQMKHQRSRSVILQKQLTHLDPLSHISEGNIDNRPSNKISNTGNLQYRQQLKVLQQPPYQQENVCPNTATHKNQQIAQLFNNNNPKKEKLTIPAPLDTNSSYFFTPNATPNTLPLSFNTYLNSTVKNARPKQTLGSFNPQASQFNISAISQDFQEYQQNPQSIFYKQQDLQHEEQKMHINAQMGNVMAQNRSFRIQSNNLGVSNQDNQFQIRNNNNNNLSYCQDQDNIQNSFVFNNKDRLIDSQSNAVYNNRPMQTKHKRVKSEETYCQRGAQNQNHIQNYSSTIQQNQSCLSYQSIASQHQQLPQLRSLTFKLHLDSLKNNESQFLLQIEELLKGGVILKKFSQFQSMKQHVFNPFLSDSMPPENCGFGTRFMSLNKNLTKIEIRHPLKPSTIESIINVEQIIRCAIPSSTTELIKLQKYAATIKVSGTSKIPNINRIPISKLEGVDNIKHYSFCVVLDKEGRVEFIAQDYRAFMAWTQGINLLIKMRKQLPRLKNHIEQLSM